MPLALISRALMEAQFGPPQPPPTWARGDGGAAGTYPAAMRFVRAGAVLVSAVLVFASPAASQISPAPAAGVLTPAQVEAIDAIAATVIERKATPSVAIGVVKNGRLVFAKGYGLRNLDDKVAADADTLYSI